jgi:hypothetical protein
MQNCFGKFLLIITFFLYQSGEAQLLSWGHRIGGTGSEYTNSLSVDVAGNVYTAADFADTIDADPGPAIQQFISKGGFDANISKFDAAGNLLWAFSIGGPGTIETKVMATASGDLIVAGIFSDSIDLDPGIDSLKIGDIAVGAFVARYTSAGQLVWGKKIIPAASAINMTDITTDATGNLYFTGVFIGSAVDFDSGPGTFILGNGTNYADFILKLDAVGNFIWARAKTSTGDGWSMAWSIAVDASGNVYNTGMFHGTVDLNSSAGVMNVTANGYFDAYLTKLDAAGNFVWTSHIGSGPGDESGRGVEVDATGNIYTCGSFSQSNDFDPGVGVVQITPVGVVNIYITKYSSAAALQWVKTIGGVNGNVLIWPSDLSMDATGNLYTTGIFSGEAVDFNPGSAVYGLAPTPGFRNSFICKLDNNGIFVMAASISGEDNLADKIKTDACGNIYLSGVFNGPIDGEPLAGNYPIIPGGGYDCFYLKLSQSNWTGNVSTDWFDPLNWACNTVPGIRSNVIIPTGAIRFPILTAPTEVKTILLQPSASMQVEPGVEFKLNGQNN